MTSLESPRFCSASDPWNLCAGLFTAGPGVPVFANQKQDKGTDMEFQATLPIVDMNICGT